MAKYQAKQTIFTQGDTGKYVMYIRAGRVKLTVVNSTGKEAVVEILGPGDFVGVRCLTGRSVYTAAATAMVPSTILVIEKRIPQATYNKIAKLVIAQQPAKRK